MCVQSFHMMNIDVPAGVGAPSLDTQPLTCKYFSSTDQTLYNIKQLHCNWLTYALCANMCVSMTTGKL